MHYSYWKIAKNLPASKGFAPNPPNASCSRLAKFPRPPHWEILATPLLELLVLGFYVFDISFNAYLLVCSSNCRVNMQKCLAVKFAIRAFALDCFCCRYNQWWAPAPIYRSRTVHLRTIWSPFLYRINFTNYIPCSVVNPVKVFVLAV